MPTQLGPGSWRPLPPNAHQDIHVDGRSPTPVLSPRERPDPTGYNITTSSLTICPVGTKSTAVAIRAATRRRVGSDSKTDKKSQFTRRRILLIADVLFAGVTGRNRLTSPHQGALRSPVRAIPVHPRELPHAPPKTEQTGGRVGVEQNLHATAAGSSREALANART